jgi:hypothetical protein
VFDGKGAVWLRLLGNHWNNLKKTTLDVKLEDELFHRGGGGGGGLWTPLVAGT